MSLLTPPAVKTSKDLTLAHFGSSSTEPDGQANPKSQPMSEVDKARMNPGRNASGDFYSPTDFTKGVFQAENDKPRMILGRQDNRTLLRLMERENSPQRQALYKKMENLDFCRDLLNCKNSVQTVEVKAALETFKSNPPSIIGLSRNVKALSNLLTAISERIDEARTKKLAEMATNDPMKFTIKDVVDRQQSKEDYHTKQGKYDPWVPVVGTGAGGVGGYALADEFTKDETEEKPSGWGKFLSSSAKTLGAIAGAAAGGVGGGLLEYSRSKEEKQKAAHHQGIKDRFKTVGRNIGMGYTDPNADPNLIDTMGFLSDALRVTAKDFKDNEEIFSAMCRKWENVVKQVLKGSPLQPGHPDAPGVMFGSGESQANKEINQGAENNIWSMTAGTAMVSALPSLGITIAGAATGGTGWVALPLAAAYIKLSKLVNGGLTEVSYFGNRMVKNMVEIYEPENKDTNETWKKKRASLPKKLHALSILPETVIYPAEYTEFAEATQQFANGTLHSLMPAVDYQPENAASVWEVLSDRAKEYHHAMEGTHHAHKILTGVDHGIEKALEAVNLDDLWPFLGVIIAATKAGTVRQNGKAGKEFITKNYQQGTEEYLTEQANLVRQKYGVLGSVQLSWREGVKFLKEQWVPKPSELNPLKVAVNTGKLFWNWLTKDLPHKAKEIGGS